MLTRVLNMGIGELTDRSRQEASKWLERRGVRPRDAEFPGILTDSTGRWGGSSAEVDASVRSLPFEQFMAKSGARFFQGPSEGTASLLTQVPLRSRQTVVDAAERILLGRFELLGYRDLDFGDPVDWHFDPISGQRSPAVHWSRIDPTNAGTVGDVKVVWELSRQQHLVTLGLAYRMTEDERYAKRFATLVEAWMLANPVGVGINWTSSLEAALRVVSWCWSLLLFRSSPNLTAALFNNMASGIEAHAAHIERYLSRHSSPNTHLTGEALGLVYAGLLFPQDAAATRWSSLGRDILEEQIHIQVLPDGVYFEQSTTYQIYTVEIYLHYLILAARNGMRVSLAVRESVQRMLDVLLALRRPDGGMPAIGDGDGGSLLRLQPRSPDDARGLFAVAAAFFKRSDYAWAAEGAQPEAFWLLGQAAVSDLAAMGALPPSESSRAFRSGGYVVMRSGWNPDAHHLVFDAGPLGCPMSGAHGHADLLSVQVSPFGEPCVVDPGTYTYSADPSFRDYFRGTRSHATLLVDGLGQAEPAGPFKWRKRPNATLSAFRSTSAYDLADASHQAYARFDDPVVHRRRVAFIKSPACYWVILDEVFGAGEHDVDLRFQFAPLHLQMGADHWVRAVGSRGRGLLLRTFSSAPLYRRIAEGSTAPLEGWVSSQYGQRQKAPLLSSSATVSLPLRILTVMAPAAHATMSPPRVQPVHDRAGALNGLTFEEEGVITRFEADSFTIEGSESCRA